MAVIHRTTLKPTKLELLTPWLPEQPWYLGGGSKPELARAGGFRLDDPQGEVGVELMVVTDTSGAQQIAYFVPLSYRGAPLEGAEHALIGTSEHGVLGRRWVYDGVHDPVVVAQLFALLLGEAVPQAQSESHVADPSVTGAFTGEGLTSKAVPTDVTHGPGVTDLVVPTASPAVPSGHLTVRVRRALSAAAQPPASARTSPDLGHVTAGWLLPDGATARAPFVVVRDAAGRL
ncbi:1,4-alpha-glucan branching protein [Streptomyces sp. NPDC051322]|uniref:maltokinase N-terminal cap-like domain-containing protein n=1 Tax=Streptomyces sp. NPDC051322 TaxID=3154645 RepID=UPI00344EE642